MNSVLVVTVGLLVLASSGLGEWSLTEGDAECLDSEVCQGYSEVTETKMNEQINMELSASYAYLAMYNYFSRDNPALKGFAKFFFKAYEEEAKHAKLLIDYQNLRGGKVELATIVAPTEEEWKATPTMGAGLAAMKKALVWERSVNKNLRKLHTVASGAGDGGDPMTMDFLETNLLSEQLDAIFELSSFVHRLDKMTKANPGLGEHFFDQELLN